MLAHERRASPHTLRAYGDDLDRFLDFLHTHTGGAVGEHTLASLTPADIRAFITVRWAEGLGASGVQRMLAAVRSFYRFLAQEGILESAAPRAVMTVPFLVFAAPFIIMRNTIRGRRIENRRIVFVMVATVIAGIWSLMSGTCVVMFLQATGIVA